MEQGRVIWSRKADNYLERTYKFIAKDSEVYAHRFIKSLILYTEEFFTQDLPSDGRAVPEFEGTPLAYLKEIIYRGYRIIYEPAISPTDSIYVVLVISGRQDIQRHI
jgi:plasmid stabilization system protein ParE